MLPPGQSCDGQCACQSAIEPKVPLLWIYLGRLPGIVGPELFDAGPKRLDRFPISGPLAIEPYRVDVANCRPSRMVTPAQIVRRHVKQLAPTAMVQRKCIRL